MFATEEYAQVFIDCAITDKNGDLIFTSLYGGENSINRILAAIENNHLKRLTFYTQDTFSQFDLPDKKQLKCKKAKIVNPTFEHFVHCFIFNRHVHFSDGVSRSHILIAAKANSGDMLWARIKAMTVTPLLDQWSSVIIEQLFQQERITKNMVITTKDKSAIQCYTLQLGLLDLNPMVIDMLKNNQLDLPA